MLCVMWLPNERTFYSFPSSLKCFTFLLVWKREKPCHPSTCVLCSCDWIENLLSKNAVCFSWRASYPETHEALQCSFPLEDHPNSILFLSHTHYHVCSLACFPSNAKGCLYDLSLQCLLRKLQFFRSKREEKEKRIILTRNASLKAYANISPIGKSFVWSRN